MFSITHIDTACVLININGFRILTDPTLDPAGDWYYHGWGSVSRKTESPSLPEGGLPPIDLVLLSHHQHKDNLDKAGKALVSTVPLVLTTKPAARVISNGVGLDEWEEYIIETALVSGLRITATPAQHHPSWLPGFLAGKVTGFVLQWDSQKNGVLYISGDTVYFQGMAQIAQRYCIDTGLFNLGAAQFPYLTGWGKYTMDARGLFKAVDTLQPRKVVPLHYKGWSHFHEREKKLRKTLSRAPAIFQKTFFLPPGVETVF